MSIKFTILVLMASTALTAETAGKILTGVAAGSEADKQVVIEAGAWRYLGKVTDAGLALVKRSTVAADGKVTEEKVDSAAVLADSKAVITLTKGVEAGTKVVIVTKN